MPAAQRNLSGAPDNLGALNVLCSPEPVHSHYVKKEL